MPHAWDAVHLLHAAPAPGAALAGARRAPGGAAVWLECVWYSGPGEGVIGTRWLSRGSPAPVDVLVDEASGLVFMDGDAVPSGGDVDARALQASVERANARLGTAGGAPPTLSLVAAVVHSELARAAGSVWPRPVVGPRPSVPPSLRPALCAAAAAAVAALAAHPELHRRIPGGEATAPSSAADAAAARWEAALGGLAAQVALLSNAVATLRRQLVCHPVPPWALESAGGGSSGGSSGGGVGGLEAPHLGSHRELDAGALSAAVRGLPPMGAWAAALRRAAAAAGAAAEEAAPAAAHHQRRPPAAAVSAAAGAAAGAAMGAALRGDALLGALPAEALLLVHWLLCLAPVRLVRLPPARRGVPEGGAAAAEDAAPPADSEEGGGVGEVREVYAVVHGPPPPQWAACAHAQHPAVRGGGPERAPVCACDGTGVRAWDQPAAEEHGLLLLQPPPPERGGAARAHPLPPLVAYHGSVSENAHSILHAGLRPLSGTRHEASGSLYGDGVYLASGLGVSCEFARAVGVAWDGLLPPVGASGAPALPPPPLPAGGAPLAPCRLRPVFGCHVVAAPEVGVVVGGKRSDVSAARAGGGSGGGVAVGAGSYVVVPSPLRLRIVELVLLREQPPAAGGEAQLQRQGAGVAPSAGGAAAPPAAAQRSAATCRASLTPVAAALLLAAAAAALWMVAPHG